MKQQLKEDLKKMQAAQQAAQMMQAQQTPPDAAQPEAL
jgi:hypothetical protein